MGIQKSGFILLSITFLASTRKLPDILEHLRCPLDENIDECFTNNGNKVIPLIAQGIPDVGVPSMDPLQMKFRQLIKHPQLQLNISNISFYGLRNMRLLSTKLNLDEGLLTESLICENITIKGTYSITGKFMTSTLRGIGPFSMYLKHGIYNVTNHFTIVNKDGGDYMKRYHTAAEISIEDADFHFKNENQQLGESITEILHKNWQHLLNDYGRVMEEYIEELMGQFFDKFVEPFSLKDLFS